MGIQPQMAPQTSFKVANQARIPCPVLLDMLQQESSISKCCLMTLRLSSIRYRRANYGEVGRKSDLGTNYLLCSSLR